MNFKKYSFLLLSLFVLTFTACDKDEPQTEPTTPGSLKLEFEHVWGSSGAEFSLNKQLTHPRTSDVMTFSTFKYYVSNVKLQKEDGTWYSLPESYYIVDADPATGSNEIKLSDIPAGKYRALEVMYGVDSTRNVSGAQQGALDPERGMFWSWNTGYIMVKAEGSSPNSSTGSFSFHLGGFRGENAVPRIFKYEFGESVSINGNEAPSAHMITNVASLWHSAENLSVRNRNHMPNAIAKSMTGDFYERIRFDHLHK